MIRRPTEGGLGGHLEARVSQGEDTTDYEGCKEAAKEFYKTYNNQF